MPVEVKKTSSEWIVAKDSNLSSISVCISVENGQIRRIKLNGLKEDSIYIDEKHLRPLWGALTEALQELRASQVRTEPDEASEIRLLPQEEFAKVRLAERERCAQIAESYDHTCSCHIAEDIAALVRMDAIK